MFRRKLKAEEDDRTRHMFWLIVENGVVLARVMGTHGSGELRNRERGNIARSLQLNEHELQELKSCTRSRDQVIERLRTASA